MNAVVVAPGPGHSQTSAGLRPRSAVPLLLCIAGSSAWALDSDPLSTIAAQSAAAGRNERARPQLEISASSLPRFDNTDGSNRTSHVDMTWMPPRRSAVGLSLGMTSMEAPALAGAYPPAAPSMNLGFHWRYTLDSNYRVDVRAWRRLVPADALTLVEMREPSYGARVEMQIGASPKSAFVADRGFLGLQLESGARVTVRRSGGKPMIYYRTKF